jgi:glycosyltransferase involved in cell wall biosynthesis
MSEKIILLLENGENLFDMGQESLNKVQAFRWEKIAAETSRIYSTIVNAYEPGI